MQKDDDRSDNFDWSMNWTWLPIFCSGTTNLFTEQQILNLYSEAENPSHFYPIVAISSFVLLQFLIMSVGIMGSLAFGSHVQSVLIYNMPPKNDLCLIARIFFMICIMGSFVLQI